MISVVGKVVDDTKQLNPSIAIKHYVIEFLETEKIPYEKVSIRRNRQNNYKITIISPNLDFVKAMRLERTLKIALIKNFGSVFDVEYELAEVNGEFKTVKLYGLEVRVL